MPAGRGSSPNAASVKPICRRNISVGTPGIRCGVAAGSYYCAGIGISVAACIALVLAFTVSSHLMCQKEWIVVTNDTGSQDHLILPDGSGVWLYYGASISYPEHFEKNRRDIRLTGEAFFDVVADRTRPFVVETSLLEVEVLGTRFNLSASDEAAQVVLESGSVNLGRLEAGEVVRQVLLKPGEMAEVSSLR